MPGDLIRKGIMRLGVGHEAGVGIVVIEKEVGARNLGGRIDGANCVEDRDPVALVRHVPATMAGGVAVFDFNNDGRPDIFLTNGANIESLQKDSPKYKNHLMRNDGGGHFTDVTDRAGLAGSGYDIGAAVADFDNDGYADLFVSGVHR